MPVAAECQAQACWEQAQAQAGAMDQLVGLLLEDRGVLRAHQRVVTHGNSSKEQGEVTSGTYSPTLNRSIALARVPSGVEEIVHVEIRCQLHAARIVKPPFVRHGKVLIQL